VGPLSVHVSNETPNLFLFWKRAHLSEKEESSRKELTVGSAGGRVGGPPYPQTEGTTARAAEKKRTQPQTEEIEIGWGVTENGRGSTRSGSGKAPA